MKNEERAGGKARKGRGLLAQQAGEVLGLVQGLLGLGGLLDPGQAPGEFGARLADIVDLFLERTDGLAQAGADLRQFAAAEDERGNAEDDEQFRCAESEHVRVPRAGWQRRPGGRGIRLPCSCRPRGTWAPLPSWWLP